MQIISYYLLLFTARANEIQTMSDDLPFNVFALSPFFFPPSPALTVASIRERWRDVECINNATPKK